MTRKACLQISPPEIIMRIFREVNKLDSLSTFMLLRTCRLCRDIGVTYLLDSKTTLIHQSNIRVGHCPCGCDSRLVDHVEYTSRDDSTNADLYELMLDIEIFTRRFNMPFENLGVYLQSRYLDVLYKLRDDSKIQKEAALVKMFTQTWFPGSWDENLRILQDLKEDIGLDFYARKWKIVLPSDKEEDDHTWKKEMEDQLALNMLVDAAKE